MKNFLRLILSPLVARVPGAVVLIRYFLRFGRIPHLRHPQNLNEKILHLALYTDTHLWTELADKYKVREYIEAQGLGNLLVPLIGVWERVEDIPWGELPQKFILKANNGDGKGANKQVDKEKMTEGDWQTLRKRLNGWLRRRHIGAMSGEPQYRGIKPLILAEELLPIPDGHTSLVDYKLWCFNGEPHSFLVCSNRQEKTGEVSLGCYDLSWNYLPQRLRATSHHIIPTTPLPRPECLEQMIEVGRKLSKPFPQVRVDLYEVNGKVYFGELTFTSLGGMMNYYTSEALLDMGKQITIQER